MTPTPSAVAAAPSAHVQHTNRLIHEKSPYLLQHAHNPVDWFPWGEEAFTKARQEKKPIFLSIGYSTCHWCHVMEHESFENEEVAAFMNSRFVNIKVDREERPDVDRVYMTFVQATTGGGGWPLNVWLTPALKPFVGGTYFPPEDRHGQPSFLKVLRRIAEAWESDRGKISESSNQIMAALTRSATAAADDSTKVDPKLIDAAYQQITRNYDSREGGFGGAPKFPRPVTLNFLFHVYHRSPKGSETGEAAAGMALFTLRKMAAGGMHDQLGGGFHRYSVDALWRVPHFEKMLYDQAQLASAYLDAYQVTGDLRYEAIARDTLDYVRRDLTDKDGGFYSAEDADSVVPGRSEKAEGAFYVWSKSEIDQSLGEDAELFDYQYGVEADGNAPAESDAQGEFRGKNILYERQTFAETAKHFKKSELDVDESMRYRRANLLELRSKRPRPHLDDKIITAWNGLMISAFARGAQVLGDPTYLETARRAAAFVRQKLYDASAHTLRRSYRNGPAEIGGFAEDYAFYIQGLLDLYEASFDVQWLRLAEQLQDTQDRLFWDEKNGGYFTSTGDDPSVLLRLKEDNDNAEPAPSSIAAMNLLRLGQIRDSKEMHDRAQKTITAFAGSLNHFPSAMPQMLVALDLSLTTAKQIIIAGEPDAPETRDLLEETRRHYLPNTVVLLADGGEGQKYLAGKLEEMKEMRPIDGQPAAYVCENFTCKAPVTSVEELRKLLIR